MDNYFEDSVTRSQQRQYEASGRARVFMQRVFTIMAFGLGITAMTAWYFGNNVESFPWLFTSPWYYIVMFAPLGFVLALSFGIHKMSYTTANIVFAVYAMVMGMSLSFIFVAYSLGTIFQTFFVTAGTFGAMALIGATTKIDLSKYSSYLFMALIGLIIASVVNMFLGSTVLEWIVSFAGVLIFSGLTAYDTQRLIQIGAHSDIEDENIQKAGLMGALALYLDFINLFLFLLRIFGGSRD
ncbi:MAG: Bax inhibitor-1/YccA family protein [Bacteroidota bacterium]